MTTTVPNSKGLTKQVSSAYAPLFPYLPLVAESVLAPNEIVIDSFSGIGGASGAIEQVIGRPFAPQALTNADHERRLVLVTVQGETYILADVGMRILTPRELARAQGFSDDYILDGTLNGKRLSKEAQVRGVGNSVCREPAAALLAANLTHAVAQAAD